MTLPARALKPKKCRSCREAFVPRNSLQKVCWSPACALALVEKQNARTQQKRQREERKALKETKERIKTRADHLREVQTVFNEFIRLRDRDLPCVSCGRHHQGQNHAGHFRTVKACPALRFEPLQVWKQCAPCNTHLSGNITEYRKELVRRIGEDQVRWIEGPHEPKRYSIDELKALKAEYRAKVRELKKESI